MSKDEKYLLLIQKIEKKIEKYRSNKNINRNWAFGFYILVALITAFTTLISGSADTFKDQLNVNFTILCLSASLFLVNTVVAFFNHREGYTVYRKGLNQMRRLKSKLELLKTSTDYSEDKLIQITEEYFQIVQFVDDSQIEIRGNESDAS